MGKEVKWTNRAIIDRTNIYTYWLNRNKSSVYPDKLEELFEKSAISIANFPHLGTSTKYRNVFAKIVKDYKIFYRIKSEQIQILRVWDTRQHPDSKGL